MANESATPCIAGLVELMALLASAWTTTNIGAVDVTALAAAL
jgi:hypothetical protein